MELTKPIQIKSNLLSSQNSRNNNHDTPINCSTCQAFRSKTSLPHNTRLHQRENHTTCNQTHDGHSSNEAWDDTECQDRHQHRNGDGDCETLKLGLRLAFRSYYWLAIWRCSRDLGVRAGERLRMRLIWNWGRVRWDGRAYRDKIISGVKEVRFRFRNRVFGG